MSTQQPAQARKDPKSRRPPRAAEGTVTNQHPERRYVLAYISDPSFGLSKHLEDGYTKVNGKTEKERVVCGRVEENGDVTYKGHCLVWIDREEYEARLDDGQAVIKARAGKASGPGGIDGVVGVNGRPAHDIVDN